VISSCPYKNLLEDLKKKKKKKKKNHANRKRFQGRSQEKNVRNAPGTERILMYRQKKQVIRGGYDRS
jgi:hypothetical protein